MLDWIQTAWAIAFVAALIGVGVSVVLRYRRSDAEDRRRMRWVALSLALTLIVVMAYEVAGTILSPNQTPPFAPVLGAVASIPVSISIAILRQRLFDVDVVIRRSAVFGLLWLAIAIAYWALSGALGLAAGVRLPLQGAIVVTVAAAAAFRPVRVWLERTTYRVVYGRRAEAYEVIRDFGAALARTPEAAQIGPRLAEAARLGLGARWARVGITDDGGRMIRDLGTAGHDEGPAALSAPLLRDGRPVAVIECGPRADGAYSRRDEEVLASLARQAALAIHSAAQAQELEHRAAAIERQAGEIAASRARIVEAQEHERRRIERDLHDGVQQQLVAIAAGIRLSRNRLGEDTAEADRRLATVQEVATRALGELRQLVHGIHPPALADAGLVPTLQDAARRQPIEVTIDADAAARQVRLAPEAAGALYFLVCEALTNIVRHAGAADACVRLRARAGAIEALVVDGGRGFDPASQPRRGLNGLEDRMAALGGTFEVSSRPGHGTSVRALLPIAADG